MFAVVIALVTEVRRCLAPYSRDSPHSKDASTIWQTQTPGTIEVRASVRPCVRACVRGWQGVDGRVHLTQTSWRARTLACTRAQRTHARTRTHGVGMTAEIVKHVLSFVGARQLGLCSMVSAAWRALDI